MNERLYAADGLIAGRYVNSIGLAGPQTFGPRELTPEEIERKKADQAEYERQMRVTGARHAVINIAESLLNKGMPPEHAILAAKDFVILAKDVMDNFEIPVDPIVRA